MSSIKGPLVHRFLSESALSENTHVSLSSEESHHLARVLRMKSGDSAVLVDGNGAWAKACVLDANPKKSILEISSVQRETVRPRLQVCFAVAKGPAVEFIIRRATELGVASFQPLITAHSLAPKQFNDERWTKIIVEVCKQCEAPFFPVLQSPLSLSQWLGSRPSQRALFFCDEADRVTPVTSEISGPCDLLVGAEGGWNDEERKLIGNHKPRRFGLGKNRLRAETAALVAVTLLKEKLHEL